MVMWWCHFLSQKGVLGDEEVGSDVDRFAIVENGNRNYDNYEFRLDSLSGII